MQSIGLKRNVNLVATFHQMIVRRCRTIHCRAGAAIHAIMKLRKKDKRSSAKKSLSKLKTVLDNSGQFGTVLDKMLCYNGRVKDDGSDLSFGDEPFARSTVFRWVPNSPSCIECLLRPRDSL